MPDARPRQATKEPDRGRPSSCEVEDDSKPELIDTVLLGSAQHVVLQAPSLIVRAPHIYFSRPHRAFETWAMLLSRARMLPARRLDASLHVNVGQARRHISWLRGLSSTTPEGEKPQAEGGDAEAVEAATPELEELATLKAKLAETEQKHKQTLDHLQRAMAEMDNIRKRTKIEVDNAYKFSVGSFAKSLLEVADNLERAIALVPENVRSGDENPMMKALYEGVKLTDDQLARTFQTQDIVRVNPLDEKFDPNFHEALFEIPDATKEAGTVGQVLSVGYKISDRCLRSAKVGVIKKA